jgi:hypothetical protein
MKGIIALAAGSLTRIKWTSTAKNIVTAIIPPTSAYGSSQIPIITIAAYMTSTDPVKILIVDESLYLLNSSTICLLPNLLRPNVRNPTPKIH